MTSLIQLYGIRFFGNENSNYSVKLELINEKSEEMLLSEKGNFTAVPLETYSRSKYDGFEFLFDDPIDIGTDTKYRMEAALISGPSSEKGTGCYRMTDWFIFSKSAHAMARTNVEDNFRNLFLSDKEGRNPDVLPSGRFAHKKIRLKSDSPTVESIRPH